MSALGYIRIAIAIIVTIVSVGVVSYAIYSSVTHSTTPPNPPGPPVVPTGPTGTSGPPGETVNMYFENLRSEKIWVIPTYGTASDAHNPRWTDWIGVPNGGIGPTGYIVPHTSSYAPVEILPGTTATMTVFTAGMASIKFLVRVDCDPITRICKMGDSTFVPYLDGPYDTQTGLYRNLNTVVGDVPWKPAIDTIVEMTWGCQYQDKSLCGINPSCITAPASCDGMSAFMGSNTGAVWNDKGFLYKDGVNILPPLKPGAPPGGDRVGVLTSKTYFDISCVDGYTVPIQLKVRRPGYAGTTTGTKCRVNYSELAPRIDNVADTDWQLIGDTSQFGLTGCPVDELVWPSNKTVIEVFPVGPSGPTDGYNNNIGSVQYVMPWITMGLDHTGSVTGSPPVKLTAGFTGGTTIDLNYYRDPREVFAATGFGFTVNDKIGCASTCSALVKNSGVSMMYPTVPGYTGHQFATGTYLVDSVQFRLDPTDRGVSDICCGGGMGPVVTNTSVQCNTSTWWIGNGATGPVVNADINANYGFGFFTNVYAPDTQSPWFVPGTEADPQSRNPYGGGPEASKYVQTVRNGVTGQHQTTRAYSYAYDDAYSTVLCESDVAANLNPGSTGFRGPYYSNYEVKMVIKP